MKKLVKFIFKLLLILIIGFVGVFFGKGYWNYLQLTETKSVDEVVNEVRASPLPSHKSFLFILYIY